MEVSTMTVERSTLAVAVSSQAGWDMLNDAMVCEITRILAYNEGVVRNIETHEDIQIDYVILVPGDMIMVTRDEMSGGFGYIEANYDPTLRMLSTVSVVMPLSTDAFEDIITNHALVVMGFAR